MLHISQAGIRASHKLRWNMCERSLPNRGFRAGDPVRKRYLIEVLYCSSAQLGRPSVETCLGQWTMWKASFATSELGKFFPQSRAEPAVEHNPSFVEKMLQLASFPASG